MNLKFEGWESPHPNVAALSNHNFLIAGNLINVSVSSPIVKTGKIMIFEVKQR